METNTPAPQSPPNEAPVKPLIPFRELIREERAWLGVAGPTAGEDGNAETSDPFNIAEAGAANEPWVSFTDADHFGIALSGGGIRSATFNLGLLQALNRMRVLQHADYLSTVSGGGYAGAFWTAWLHHRAPKKSGASCAATIASSTQGVFPEQPATAGGDTAPADTRERPEIRHLREFSRFLMPRVGVFESETVLAVVAILGGILPAITATVALLALVFYAWFCASYWLVRMSWPMSTGAFLMVVLLVHVASECQWRKLRKGGKAGAGYAGFIVVTLLALVLSGAAWWVCSQWWMAVAAKEWLNTVQTHWESVGASYPSYLVFKWIMFGPAAALGLATLALLLIRALLIRVWAGPNGIAQAARLDLATSRSLVLAGVCAVLALVWEMGSWLLNKDWQVNVAVGSPVLFAGLFAWVRKWLSRPAEESRASTILKRITGSLKSHAPKILANAAALSLIVVVGVLIQQHGMGANALCGAGGAVLVLLFTLVCFDPARVGMHDFYRSRLSRCYLGAAREGCDEAEQAAGGRPTAEQPDDEITLGQLRETQTHRQTVHLVCCAANNLAGDTLGSLYRGARSAVISPSGISLGNHTGRFDHLRLSSAITASAAAFNSQMGRISMGLGPAVAFLMSALNLRLGLWVPHPLNPRRKEYLFTGWYFFREMFGMTNCEVVKTVAKAAKDKEFDISKLDRKVQLYLRSLSLHLSDGNHFENLGLYELIRRHCRYIIVSDCSADPEVAFDDLANTLRRIREDFGVEIELEVGPLRPGADKRSRQHAVVGTIHYDGLAGTDKGTVLYFKSTLTGDEPPDVLQYQTRNPAFPHEGTGDQFYDEAQWESYRRLGEHAASAVLRSLEGSRAKSGSSGMIDNLFLEAGQRWHPAPEGHGEIFLGLTDRCLNLEGEIRDHAPAVLRAEFFPEAQASGLVKVATPAKVEDDEVKIIYFVMQVAQVMEDAWLGADLDNYWSHPLNEGWMNYFQRWASTPSFRRWWPVLRPLYNIGFRDFVKNRFDIRVRDTTARNEPPGLGAQLHLRELDPATEPLQGMATDHWERRFGKPETSGKLAFEYRLSLDGMTATETPKPIQVGFLLFNINGSTVQWKLRELFVPHSLMGAGIVARFLDAIILQFEAEPRYQAITKLEVILPEKLLSKDGQVARRPDPASRRACVQDINFYKSRGFILPRPSGNAGEPRVLQFNLAGSRGQKK